MVGRNGSFETPGTGLPRAIRRLSCRTARGAFLALTLFQALTLGSAQPAAAEIAPQATVEAPTATVLVLNSYHKGYPWTDNTVRGIEETFAAAAVPVEVWTEYMDAKRFPDESHFDHLFATYRYKFAERTFDAIITSDNVALQFLRKYRSTLFGATPVVFTGINNFVPEMIADQADMTGIAEHADFRETLLLATQILPTTDEVVVVSPNTISANEDRKRIEGLVPDLGAGLRVTFWQGLDLEKTVERVATLKAGTVILSSGIIKTRAGRVLPNFEKVRHISAAAHVPVLIVREDDLGSGALGGRVVSGYSQGAQAAGYILEILRGKDADDLPVVTAGANPFMFDYPVMRRFGIEPADLPFGSVVRNRPPAAYEHYRSYMAGAAAIIIVLGSLVGLLAVSMIGRKQAEAARRESEERLQAIIDHSPASIFLKDKQGRYVLANRQFLAGYGLKLTKLAGLSASDVFPAELAAPMLDMDVEVIRTGKSCEREFEVRSEGGEKRILMTVKFPVFDRNGDLSGIGGVSTDITDVKTASEAMRSLQAELAHVSRLSTMGEMAAGFAHELNQPLTAIKSFASGCIHRLKAPAPDIDSVVAALGEICGQASRAANIITRIRGFVVKKGGAHAPEALPFIDINAAIESAAALLASEILNYGVTLDLDLAPGLPPVRADAIQIQQLVINLARNSMEAMSDGNSPQRNLTIRTRAEHSGDVCIRVLDTGPGIGEDVLPHLFHPFFTTKESGMGMGLSICQSIVDQHGGHLEAANRKPGGAAFRVLLMTGERQAAVA